MIIDNILTPSDIFALSFFRFSWHLLRQLHVLSLDCFLISIIVILNNLLNHKGSKLLQLVTILIVEIVSHHRHHHTFVVTSF